MTAQALGCAPCLRTYLAAGRSYMASPVSRVVFVVGGESLCFEHAVEAVEPPSLPVAAPTGTVPPEWIERVGHVVHVTNVLGAGETTRWIVTSVAPSGEGRFTVELVSS